MHRLDKNSASNVRIIFGMLDFLFSIITGISLATIFRPWEYTRQ